MLTLPLDLIIYITEVGDLNIKDIFHLTQVNKLFRLKLLHPYFWHNIYNKHIGKIFEDYEINNNKLNKNLNLNWYEECKLYYWKYLEIEKEINEFNEFKNRFIDSYIEKYCFDDNYLPVLLNHLKIKENQWRLDIKNKDKSLIEFSTSSFLAKLIAVQTFRIGLTYIVDFNKLSSSFSISSYEKYWFGIGLLQKKSYKLVEKRRKRFNQIRIALKEVMNHINPIPIINEEYCFETPNKYCQYIGKLIYNLLIMLQDWRVDEENISLEAFNMLSIYGGFKGHYILIASLVLKVVEDELKDLNIKILNHQIKPKISLTYIGIIVGNRIITFFKGKPMFGKVNTIKFFLRNEILSYGEEFCLTPMDSDKLGMLIFGQIPMISKFKGRRFFETHHDINSFTELGFQNVYDRIIPLLISEKPSLYPFSPRLISYLEKFICGTNYFYLSIFKHGRFKSLPDDFECNPGCGEIILKPIEYIGKMVMLNRPDIPAIIHSHALVGITLRGLCIDSYYSNVGYKSFKVMDNVSTDEILKFIDFIGVANLSYHRITGLRFDDDGKKIPRFIIE